MTQRVTAHARATTDLEPRPADDVPLHELGELRVAVAARLADAAVARDGALGLEERVARLAAALERRLERPRGDRAAQPELARLNLVLSDPGVAVLRFLQAAPLVRGVRRFRRRDRRRGRRHLAPRPRASIALTKKTASFLGRMAKSQLCPANVQLYMS